MPEKTVEGAHKRICDGPIRSFLQRPDYFHLLIVPLWYYLLAPPWQEAALPQSMELAERGEAAMYRCIAPLAKLRRKLHFSSGPTAESNSDRLGSSLLITAATASPYAAYAEFRPGLGPCALRRCRHPLSDYHANLLSTWVTVFHRHLWNLNPGSLILWASTSGACYAMTGWMSGTFPHDNDDEVVCRGKSRSSNRPSSSTEVVCSATVFAIGRERCHAARCAPVSWPSALKSPARAVDRPRVVLRGGELSL